MLIAAPISAIAVWALLKMVKSVESATRISGNGQLAQAQNSTHHAMILAFHLGNVASTVGTLVAIIGVVIVLLRYAQ